MAKLEPHPLMRTIVDHPDLDPPRLVYADWLDEQGDPKMSVLAEYIRLSIEQESLTLWSDPQDRIERRLQELEQLDSSALRPPMPQWAIDRVRLHRGLPFGLTCSLAEFAEGADVLEFAPITRLTLRFEEGTDGENPPGVAALGRPEFRRIRSLQLGAGWSARAFAALVMCPNVSYLAELGLHDYDSVAIGRAIDVLAGFARQFASLTKLAVPYTQVSPQSRELLRAAFRDRLELG